MKKLEQRKRGNIAYRCLCDCGNVVIVSKTNLHTGHVKSCGCLRGVSHHLSKTRLYNIWRKMKARCYNKNTMQYRDWGGRGIKVCDEWRNNFQAFYNWSMTNGYQEDLTIDRIDNNKGYSPSNCRWVDVKTQARNKRNNRNITINGDTYCLTDWCKVLNLNYKKVHNRINTIGLLKKP